MKKRNKDISLMEQIELENKKQEQQKLKDEKNKTPKPYLLKRIWAGLLDFIFIVILFVGFQVVLTSIINNSSYYENLVNQTQDIYKQSHLYDINENNDFVEYSKEDDLDKVITLYYSTDAYAMSNEKLKAYNQAKLDSTYFIYDGNNNLIVKDNVKDDAVKLFYYSEYKQALEFLETNPTYDKLVSKITVINLYSILLSITLATAIIYLLIPLFRKEGETPAQIINKLCIVDARNMKQIKKWQIVVRYLILLLFDYFLPIVLFVQNNVFIPITIIITIGMMCVTKNNVSPHDFATQSIVILKRRADEFTVLKSITNQ